MTVTWYMTVVLYDDWPACKNDWSFAVRLQSSLSGQELLQCMYIYATCIDRGVRIRNLGSRSATLSRLADCEADKLWIDEMLQRCDESWASFSCVMNDLHLVPVLSRNGNSPLEVVEGREKWEHADIEYTENQTAKMYRSRVAYWKKDYKQGQDVGSQGQCFRLVTEEWRLEYCPWLVHLKWWQYAANMESGNQPSSAQCADCRMLRL